jgi:transposase
MKRTASHEIKGPGGALPVRPDDVAAVDLAMLIEGETSGRPLDEVLAVYDRSRSTYYEKLRRFREQGLEGLLARPPGPRSPWRRPIEILRFVVTTRLRHPEQSAAEIASQLERMGHRISVRSVERTLSQFGLTRAPHRAHAEPSAPAPEKAADPISPQGTPERGGNAA